MAKEVMQNNQKIQWIANILEESIEMHVKLESRDKSKEIHMGINNPLYKWYLRCGELIRIVVSSKPGAVELNHTIV